MRLIQFETGQGSAGSASSKRRDTGGAGVRSTARTGAGGDSRGAAAATRCCAEAASQARTMPGCWRREGVAAAGS